MSTIDPYENVIRQLDPENIQLRSGQLSTDFIEPKEQFYNNMSQPEKCRKPFVIERFHLPDAVKDEIQSLKPNWGFGQFSEAVFYRTYSRMKSDSTMESWNDVVIRVTEGIFSIRKDWYVKNSIEWDEDFWNVYSRGFSLSMFHMHWLPPGRGLWACGTDFIYERGSMALNNCGFIEVSDKIGEDVNWIADCLMCGTGIGAHLIRNDDFEIYWPKDSVDYIVPDSREGWANSIQAAIDCYLSPNKKKPDFDYSIVRPAGLPIKGFGGISSGPEPLIKLHKRIDMFFEMFDEHDWYDTILLKADIINATGACIVAGNVRRSAEIFTGSVHDQTFLDLKNYEKYPYRAEWGWLSNNSANFDNDEDYEELDQIATRVVTRGEPGLLNRRNIKHGRLGKFKDKVPVDDATGCNPCHSGSNLVITKLGLKTILDLQIGEDIWSDSGWTKVINKWSNGIKPVHRYITNAGNICLTEDHRVITDGMKCDVGLTWGIDTLRGIRHQPIELDPQDIMDGLLQGDGFNDHGNISLIIGDNDQDYFKSEINYLIKRQESDSKTYQVYTTHTEMPHVHQRTIPKRFLTGKPSKVLGFLRGLYSANGCISDNGGIKKHGTCVSLIATSLSVVLDVQRMLSSVGIISNYCGRSEYDRQFRPNEKTYKCKKAYQLKISQRKDVSQFAITIGFIQKYKTEKLMAFINRPLHPRAHFNNEKITYDIIKDTHIGEEEVFDLTVDNNRHTFWCNGFNVSNCGEQLLVSKELCTLAETLPTRCETVQEWYKACEYATLYASTVTLLPTHRQDTNSVMLRNRRIGIGLIDYTGWKSDIGLNQVIKHLRKGYDIVRQINHWAQSSAGVPDSIRVTTVKPSGSVSKLAGKTPGIGHPNFHYTLRRMRIAIDSPMTPLLIEANIPYEFDVVSDNTYVFEFPILQGPSKPAAEVSMWEQLSNITTVQREWSDNSVSNTVTFIPEYELALCQPLKNITGHDFKQFEGKEYKTETVGDYINIYVRNPHHEELEIESALAANISMVKSLSLLPASNRGAYKQMPEQGINKEEYEKRLSVILPIDWSKLRYSMSEPDKYCSGLQCEFEPKVASSK